MKSKIGVLKQNCHKLFINTSSVSLRLPPYAPVSATPTEFASHMCQFPYLGDAETGLELSPQATEGLFLSCEFCNPSASRCSAPPFTQVRRKVVVVAFATAVQICKCQTFSEGFQPCRHHALIGLSKPSDLPVVMTFYFANEGTIT